MACEKCVDGWIWVYGKDGDLKGMAACECRKQTLRPFNDRGEPLTEEIAATLVAGMCEVMSFAPKTPLGQLSIVRQLMQMCETAAECDYVTQKAATLHAKWDSCGIPGLRQIVTSFRLPKDGIPCSFTEAFPDGLPSSKPNQPEPPKLPPGHVVSADRQLDTEVRQIAGPNDLNSLPQLSPQDRRKAERFAGILENAITAPKERKPEPEPDFKPKKVRLSEIVKLADDPVHEPLPEGSYKRITQEDIEAAVAELHRKKQEEQA